MRLGGKDVKGMQLVRVKKNACGLELILTRDGDRGGVGGYTDPVKNASLYHCMTLFPLTVICYLFNL